MTVAEKISSRIANLSESRQTEVLDFVEFLADKAKKLRDGDAEERAGWSAFSLSQAMRGLEDEEELYTLADLKEEL